MGTPPPSRWSPRPAAVTAFNLTLVPAPAPRMATLTGCSPTYCRTGDVLTVTGVNFDPQVPAGNELGFAPQKDSLGPPPECVGYISVQWGVEPRPGEILTWSHTLLPRGS